jgi:hypothetical protein
VKKTSIILIILIILIIAVFSIETLRNGLKEENVTEPNKSTTINDDVAATDESYNNQGMVLFESEDSNTTVNSKVIIKGYYREPLSLKEKGTIILNGLTDGEFIEMIVKGEITDFQHWELQYVDAKNTWIEKRIINRVERLSDQTVIIKTIMPEGGPSEKIKWKGPSGKVFEFIIAEYNLKGD